MESQPEHHLGPPLSLVPVDGAPNFRLGEYVLVRMPGSILVDGYVDSEMTPGTALPLTSNGSSTQHFAFIRNAIMQMPDSFLLELYPVLTFSGRGGALVGYNEMDNAAKAMLLPLAPSSLRHPTPEAFGAPLNFGNWSTFRDSWLSISPRQFIILKGAKYDGDAIVVKEREDP